MSTVSEKGQVTIPKAVRDRLGLEPGVDLEFTAEGGRLIGVKKVSEDPVRKWRGRARLPCGGNVDGYIEEIRGER